MNARLSLCLQPDDSFVVAGMSDGLVQFLHRREPKTEEERRAELLTKPKMGYTRYTDYRPAPGDIVVRPVRWLLFKIVKGIFKTPLVFAIRTPRPPRPSTTTTSAASSTPAPSTACFAPTWSGAPPRPRPPS